jgi:predicted HAD superfamily hydrolase
MYFNGNCLQKILSSVDNLFNNITIYSSSDYKTSKAEGDLYKVVHDIEKVDYKNWTHFGDNKQSDIKKAKSFGINTVYIPQIELTKYEEELLKENIMQIFKLL